MGRIYTVNGKQIDIDDTETIQSLTNEEFTELFTLVKETAPVDDDPTVAPTPLDRETGTGFIIMNPPAATDEGGQR